MLIAVGLAWGLAAGVPLVVLALVGISLLSPRVALAGLGVITVGDRISRKPAGGDAAYLQAVAAELRSGAGVRAAIADAADRMPSVMLERVARSARAGRPLDELAEGLQSALGRHGGLAGAALRVAGMTGGRAAETFDQLALLALEDAELAGERRAATAQARVSAWIVGGLPTAYLVYAAGSGRLSALWKAGTIGPVILGLGALLLVGGVGAIVILVRRAQR
jgi:tight adherence protein B